MTLLIVIVLVVAWTWWGYVTWRDRRATTSRGATSIASFNNQLSVLERSRSDVRSPVRVLPARQSTVTVLRSASPQMATGVNGDRQMAQAQRLRALHTPQTGNQAFGRPSVAMRRQPSAGASTTMTLSEAQQRRRQAVLILGIGVLVSVPLALLAGGVFIPVALIVVAAGATYGVLLVRARRVEFERSHKVRSLDDNRGEPFVAGFGGYDGGYGGGYDPENPAATATSAYGDDHYGSDRYLAETGTYAGAAN